MFAEEELFALLRSTIKRMRKILDKEIYPLGIGHAEMRLLMLLYSTADGECSQDELISQIEVDRSNVSRALKKLENFDYIEKTRDQKDKRAYRIALTEKGREIREQLFEIKSCIEKTVTKEVKEQEIATLIRLLKKVENSISEENYCTIKNAHKLTVSNRRKFHV